MLTDCRKCKNCTEDLVCILNKSSEEEIWIAPIMQCDSFDKR